MLAPLALRRSKDAEAQDMLTPLSSAQAGGSGVSKVNRSSVKASLSTAVATARRSSVIIR
jgi:hypothetical protein